jgi:hypothetical protein
LELTFGLPVFFDQLREALRRASSGEMIDHSELERSASHHGHDLFHQGLTVAQVVHDYGDLCQVIALLAMEQKTTIAAAEFQTLNLCLDDAIASAVTEFSRQRERVLGEQETDCVKAAKSMGGELRVRDLPGDGCIFAIALRRLPPPETQSTPPTPDAEAA